MSVTVCMILIALLGIVVGATAVALIHKFLADYNVCTICYILDRVCDDKHIETDELHRLTAKYIVEMFPELGDDEELPTLAADYIDSMRETAHEVKQHTQNT